MRNLKSGLLALAMLSASALTMAQENPVVKYLPSKAAMVMTINFTSLGSKVSPETFRQSFMYRELMKKPNPEVMKYLANPSLAGPDFTKDFFIVFDKPAKSSEGDGTKKNKQPVFSLYGQLKSQEAFEETITKLAGEKAAVKTVGNNHILQVKEGGVNLGWNNEIFVVHAGMPEGAMDTINAYLSKQTKKPEESEGNMQLALAAISKMSEALILQLLEPKSANGFVNNPAFGQMMAEQADIRTWSKGMSPLLDRDMPAGLENLMPVFMKDREKFGITRFVNGKIESVGRSTLSPDMLALRKKYPIPSVNTDLLNRLPAGKIMGYLQFNANSDAAGEALTKMGMDKLIDSIQQKIPFNLKEMAGALKGSMMLAVIKPDASLGEDTAKLLPDGMQIVGALQIGDARKFDSLKNMIKQLIEKTKSKNENVIEGEGVRAKNMLSDFKPFTATVNDLFIFSTSAVVGKAMVAGGSPRPAPSWFPQNGSPVMVMDMNFRELISTFMKGSKRKEGGEDESLQKFLDMMGDMVIYGGELENDKMVTHTEFRFTDPDKNAMTQLFEMINVAIESSDKKKAEQRKKMEMEEMSEDKKVQDVEVPLPPPPPPPHKPVKKTAAPVKKTKS